MTSREPTRPRTHFPRIRDWIVTHPARFGTLTGWYQQACGLIAAAVTVPVILNMLSAKQSGIWFAFQGLLAMVNLTDFGLSQALARQVAFSLTCNRLREDPGPDFIATSSGWVGVAEIYLAARRLFLGLNLAALALLVICYDLVLPSGHLIEQRTSTTSTAWYLLGAATITALQSRLYQGTLDGLGQLYWGRLVSGSAQLLTGALVIVALHVQPALTGPALVVLTVSVLQMVALRQLLMAVAKDRLQSDQVRQWIPLRRLWKAAAPFGVVNSAACLVSSIQVPLLGSLLGAEVVAPFYLAQRIGQIATNLIHQFLAPQIPLFTQQIAAAHWEAGKRRMKRILLVVGAGALACFALYYLLSPGAVELWVGPGRYVPGRVLALMAVDYFLMTVAVGFAHFVLASGRNPFVTTTVIAGLINLLGCSLLPKTYGMLGVAFSGLMAGLVTNYWYAPWQGVRLLGQLGKSSVAKRVTKG